MNKLSNINIRATSLRAFWGEKYKKSIYLSYGAKHNLDFCEIINNRIPVFDDLCASSRDITRCHQFCKKYYYEILPVLVAKLNKIHGVSLSTAFWQIAFGYWLYRHIAVAYYKYSILKNFDIDNTDIKLLDEKSFYVPENHVDYLSCFSADFGVQQLVSQYYYMYQTKEKPIVNYGFSGIWHRNGIKPRFRGKAQLKKIFYEGKHVIKKILSVRNQASLKAEIALCGVSYSPGIFKALYEKSNGRIQSFTIPQIKVIDKNINFDKRRQFFVTNPDKTFDAYFLNTLIYCLPKVFLEHFDQYYSRFTKHLKTQRFNYIVAENWIGYVPNAIYIGLAKEKGIKFICKEHAASDIILRNTMAFVGYDISDINLVVHKSENRGKNVIGGFACREIIKYKFNTANEAILFIARTKFLFMTEMVQYNAVNSTFVKELRLIDDFINFLPGYLNRQLCFRPRKVNHNFCWNIEKKLDLEKRNIKIDCNDFVSSILQSRIVVIDHISTGIAEIIHMGAPFILLYDIDFLPLSEEIASIFKELVACGVVHSSAQSAVSHIEKIYANVQKWWQSNSVCAAIEKLKNTCYAEPGRNIDYLLSLLEKNN
jgi:putative transferase (TIGR04331 family)